MIVLLIAGIVILLGGLAAIGFGIPVNEFSFGNTLILSGTIGACTGAILMGLSVVLRELKGSMRPLAIPASDIVATGQRERRPPADTAPNGLDESLMLDRAAPSISAPEPVAEPLPGEQPHMVEPPDAGVADVAPPAKRGRNLLFASSSRKERERAAAKTTDPIEEGAATATPADAPVSKPVPTPPSFDDAWPRSERGRSEEAPPRRAAPAINAPSNGAQAAERYAPARSAEQPPVTVLKSGIVDGMAYSLYSDGSIEAQMPEGMMRFASIDELRSHLDQRP